MRPAPRAAFALATVVVAACSLVVGSDSVQCTTNADCQSRGGEFAATTCVGNVCVGGAQASDASSDGAADVAKTDVGAGDAGDAIDDAADGSAGPWACLGKVTPPVEDQTRSVTMNFQVTDIVNKPISGMVVNVCDRTDPQCLTPVIPAPLNTDAEGMVSFQVPYAARVFVVVTNPEGVDGAAGTEYLEAVYYVDPPPTSTPPLTVIENLTLSGVNGLASLAPHPYNPSEGILILQVQNCTFTPGVPEPGVQFSLSTSGGADAGASDTEEFYLDTTMMPDYAVTQTSTEGVGGFVNAPPGLTTITGTLVQGNTRIGQNEVVVKAATVTYATIDPYEN